MTDAEILDAARQLRVAYNLKRTLRYNSTRNLDEHSESVAEHVFSLILLAEYFLPLEDPHGLINVRRLHEILLYHDFGEVVHGDIAYHRKTAEHKKQEAEDALATFAALPKHMQDTARSAWEEYEAKQTLEAKFADALDKIDPLFELFDPINEKTLKRTKFTFEDHVNKKYTSTKDFPLMRHFVDVLSNDLHARGVFWEPEATPV